MADEPLDYAVLGSTPLAVLLAGLLTEVHKKSVVLVSESHSSFRLTRGLDLSVGAITRPETWALLHRTVPEVRKLLATIGARSAIERVDPLLAAETTSGAEVLSHLRYLLLAHGAPIERLTTDGTGATYRIRDVLRISRSQLAGPVARWLQRSGVRTVPVEGTTVTLRRDGVRIESAGTTLEAAHAVAADDAAILAYLDAGDREAVLRTGNATTLLTEPMKSLPAPLTLVVDRGLALLQKKGGAVQVLAGGGGDAVSRAVARLGASGKVRRAGQTGFSVLVPVDGAPVIGGAKSLKATVVSGVGPVAAFLAPAIARHLAESASEEERAWFAARDLGKEVPRAAAIEFGGSFALGSAP